MASPFRLTQTQQETYEWALEVDRSYPKVKEEPVWKNCLYWLRRYVKFISVNLDPYLSDLSLFPELTDPDDKKRKIAMDKLLALKVKSSSRHVIVRGRRHDRITYSPRVFFNSLRRLSYFRSCVKRGADVERSIYHPLYIEWRNDRGRRLYLDSIPGPLLTMPLIPGVSTFVPRPLNPSAREFVQSAARPPTPAPLVSTQPSNIPIIPKCVAAPSQTEAMALWNCQQAALSTFRSLFPASNQVFSNTIRFAEPSWPPGWVNRTSAVADESSYILTPTSTTESSETESPPLESSGSTPPSPAPTGAVAAMAASVRRDLGERVGRWVEARASKL
jgi:hypothetical protein